MNKVDEYLEGLSEEARKKIQILRDLVKKLCPKAQESFTYGIIGYKYNKKPLIYFGGYKSHIGIYATPNSNSEFKEELKEYKQGKGSFQIPLNTDLPIDLITKIIKFKMMEISSTS